jgi:hypothetical protein
MRVISAALLIPVVLAVGCATKAPVASQPGPEPVTASAPPEAAAPAAPAPATPRPPEDKADPAKPAAPPAAKPAAPSTATSEPATAKPAAPAPVPPAAPSTAKPTPSSPAKPAAPATAKPATPSTAKPAAPPVTKPAPSEATAKPAAPAPSAPKPAAPSTPKVSALDLETLKEQLKGTKAIGVFTKLTLKNQVDDLLDRFRDHYAGKNKVTMSELRRSYDLLMMKVLSLIQDKDQKLATDIVASREAIWGLLADKEKFAALDV